MRGATAGALLLGLLALLPAALSMDKYIEDTDRFPGWRGELPDSVGAVNSTYGQTVGFGELGQVGGRAAAAAGAQYRCCLLGAKPCLAGMQCLECYATSTPIS